MDPPRPARIFAGVDDPSLVLDPLVRRASGRTRLAPLVRALGFRPPASEPAVAEPAAFGLDGGDVAARIAVAGERDGMTVLLVELSGPASAGAVSRVVRRVQGSNPARRHLLLLAEPRYARLVFASGGLDGEPRWLAVERTRPGRSDLEALAELAAREGEGGVALALRHARALDRSRVTRQFFRDFRAQRARISAAWTGIPADAVEDRDRLALLLLCRLMFLYFLQRRGHLAGNRAFLPGLVRKRRGTPAAGGLYRNVFVPLFFGALNTRPEDRSPEARALGPLPYLNGGLFERDALERRHPDLDLPDDAAAGVFDGLLERYRFTAREARDAAVQADGGAGDGGVDPEMLGRVFEGLMAAERRGATGTYYTPAPVVDRLVREATEAYLAGVPARGDARAAAALADVKVLDPACGSGAFLLGALSHLARLRLSFSGRAPASGPAEAAALRELRRDIVARALHGVDIQEDAALLCSLRLWLALAVGGEDGGDGAPPPPLPNLDRRIRQGDALVDPLDLALAANGDAGPWRIAAADPSVRHAVAALRPLAAHYLEAGPEERPALARAIGAAEAELARAWLEALERRLRTERSELLARSGVRDLFGEVPSDARAAEAACREVERRLAELAQLRSGLEDQGELPFFSFGVHFAEAAARGFDLILSNPPWVRAHRWPESVRRVVRRRYTVCRRSGWRAGAALAGAPAAAGGQVDLSLLFLERSLRLLAPGGVAALLVPAKALRSLYGGGARRLLLEEAELVAVEDHSLDQRSIFRADAFAAALVARRRRGAGAGAGREAGGGGAGSRCDPEGGDGRPEAVGVADAGPGSPMVRVTLVRRGVEPLRFTVPQDELPLLPGDPEAPWLLVPPEVGRAIRRMQAAGPPLGRHPGLRVRRGVITGANDVLLVRDAAAKLGGLARIRAEGWHRARRTGRPAAARRYAGWVETASLGPLVRGSGIGAWRYRTAGYILWIHDDETGRPGNAPPRTAAYLARHRSALERRSGARPGGRPGALFRVTADTLRPKVAWHDLADTLKAVALPARIPGPDGRPRPLVPLNTVYFVPADTEDRALLLAGLLNSLPARCFARAAAERAKDARFRFFGWTVSALPLPVGWDRSRAAAGLLDLSREAHRRGGLEPDGAAELDRAAAALYGLTSGDLAELSRFDAWLRGEGSRRERTPGRAGGHGGGRESGGGSRSRKAGRAASGSGSGRVAP